MKVTASEGSNPARLSGFRTFVHGRRNNGRWQRRHKTYTERQKYESQTKAREDESEG